MEDLLSYLIQRMIEISQKLLETSDAEVCYHDLIIYV